MGNAALNALTTHITTKLSKIVKSVRQVECGMLFKRSVNALFQHCFGMELIVSNATILNIGIILQEHAKIAQ